MVNHSVVKRHKVAYSFTGVGYVKMTAKKPCKDGEHGTVEC